MPDVIREVGDVDDPDVTEHRRRLEPPRWGPTERYGSIRLDGTTEEHDSWLRDVPRDLRQVVDDR